MMDMKSMMIDFHNPRTNQSLSAKLTGHYIKREGNVVAYTIGGYQAVDKMQRNLMG